MVRILVAAFVATFVAAIAAAVAAPVFAQTMPVEGDMRAKLMAMDTDHDGKWSRAEWIAGGRKERGFDMMDTNRDGHLTMDEIRAGREKMKAMREAQVK